MRSADIPSNYWIYLLVVVFGVPTLIDAWSFTVFLAIASCSALALALAIARYRWKEIRDERQAQEIRNAAQALSEAALAARKAAQDKIQADQFEALTRLSARYVDTVASPTSHDNTLIRLEFIVTQHAAELTLRRRQLTTTSYYGLVDNSEWLQEVEFFIDEVIDKSGGEAISSADRLCGVRRLIETATAGFASSRDSFSPDMDPISYEQMVADSLSDLGWDTRLTKPSGDQGVDVIAEKRGKRVAIQCKRYATAIGNSAVQEAFAGKSFENADYAAVVTNAEFTRSARQLANTTQVILLHHDELSKLELRICGTVATPIAGVRSASSVGPMMYMTPVCYEQAVADGLRRLGWQTQLKKTTEDRYADVIAELRGKRVLIQCWGFMAPCIPTLEEVREAKLIEDADYAAIVSNAEFRPRGYLLARSVGIELLRHDNLNELEPRIFAPINPRGIAVADAA